MLLLQLAMLLLWLKELFLKNLANMITLLGVSAAVWLLILAILRPGQIVLMLFLTGFIGLTDLLDGIVAKRLKIKSRIGGAMDRLRDKLFICPTLVILTWHYWLPARDSVLLPGFTEALVILIVAIEAILTFICFAGIFKKLDVSSNEYGRKKMFCQFTVVMVWFLSLTIEKYSGLSIVKFSIYFIDFSLAVAVYFALRSLAGYFQRYTKNPR